VPPTGMLVGLKALAIVGADKAVTVNVALAVPPVPPLLEVTLPVVLLAVPVVESVTPTVIVQFWPPLMLAPVRPIVVTGGDPDVFVLTVPPLQFVLGPEATVMPTGNVSATPTPVSVVLAFGLVMVIVSVDVLPAAMLVGLNAFVIVGAFGVTVTVGEVAILVRVPLLPSLVCVVKVLVPGVDGAVTCPLVP